MSFVSKKMSTPTFRSKPRPETKTLLVGGPDFLESVMEGAALAIPQSSKDATNRRRKRVIGRERSSELNMFSPFVQAAVASPSERQRLETCGTILSPFG